jgi:hypothetical protein
MPFPMWGAVTEVPTLTDGERPLDAASEQFEEVGGGDDADDAATVRDDETSDRPAAKQVRRLPYRSLGFDGDHTRGHQLGHETRVSHWPTMATTHVSIGNHSDNLTSLGDDEMVDALHPHQVTRLLRRCCR